ncbi:uncharacterized protein H6S33_001648 [Morchella sextelata]|uniref:uncharacterized protein n=1 Tax=Morchella sextelata TaxID=1174677 RepID=UPI001D04864B|nr:uncharacterized protein H6S33_001648 [Morchella sextelata]KAH0608514.1 hypothetical protein H6S33_001648 [Morchella sextelata]
MDLLNLHGVQPGPDSDSINGSLNKTYTDTDSTQFPSDFTGPLFDLLNIGLGVLVLKSRFFDDDMATDDFTGQTIIPGTFIREDVKLFQVITPGTYHIGLLGITKLNDHAIPNIPEVEEGTKIKPNSVDETQECGESDVPPKECVGANSDSDDEIQEHGKSEDWWKESRWMKVRAIPEARGKPPFEWRDLRKNWRRFAALTARDRSLRFNTPRLRSTRRAVFGEQMGVRGVKHRRDMGIDYGKKEKMILPPIGTRLSRKKNKLPPVFRGVPKVFYDWSRRPGVRKWEKLSDAPKEFYDWSKRMEEEKQDHALAELSDFERFVARSAQREPRSDFESFLKSKGAEIHESRDIGRYKYKDLERDIDPDVSGFGGYDEMSISTSGDESEDEDENSDSTFDESEDEYANDDLVAMAWEGQEI